MTNEGNAAEVDPVDVFSRWLKTYAAAMEGCDLTVVARTLADDCWWRDLLALTWDLGTYRGPKSVERLLAKQVVSQPYSFLLDTAYGPRLEHADGQPTVEGFFTFETAEAWCRGVARLHQVGHDWRAWTVMTGMEDLKGHERATGPRRPLGPRRVVAATTQRSWAELRVEQRSYQDHEPDVVVVGASQGGLTVAANLGLMGVDTLLVERNERVGDSWRKRYHSLVLHDPVWADHLPYLPFPANWPVYAAKDKIANWFEHYAEAMELNVWCLADLRSGSYDPAAGRWTLHVATPAGDRVVRPSHVILATGAAGEPNIIEIPGRDAFTGTAYHSSQHESGSTWVGKRAVVVGAGNSGHDIAQDLYEAGAEVTMVQRSSTYIMSQENGIPAVFGLNYTESGPPTEYADLLASATPWPMVLENAVAQTAKTAEDDHELLAALDQVGFRRNDGPDGTGLMGFALTRGGGYYIDVGCSRLIANGKINLVQGSGVARFVDNGIQLKDGRTIEADLVVLATGYQNMRATARRIFGDEVADKCSDVLGIGDDGEICGIYRRTGQRGLWFMAGPLAWVRIYSKHLALEVAADVHAIAPGALHTAR